MTNKLPMFPGYEAYIETEDNLVKLIVYLKDGQDIKVEIEDAPSIEIIHEAKLAILYGLIKLYAKQDTNQTEVGLPILEAGKR